MPKPQKILIIEDEKDMRDALADELTHAGFVPRQTKNGREGLAAAFSERPDLILLDIVMPDMDGTAVMKQLRQDSWGKRIPVMILTNTSTTDRMAEWMPVGESSQYFVKSDWSIADIVARVRDALLPYNDNHL